MKPSLQSGQDVSSSKDKQAGTSQKEYTSEIKRLYMLILVHFSFYFTRSARVEVIYGWDDSSL